jgi:cytochrome P460
MSGKIRASVVPVPRRASVALALAAIVGLVATVYAGTDLQPPTGYRQWFHVNTMVIDKPSPLFEAMGGMHNVSVNAIGLPALEKGTVYPDNTIFVVDLHEFTLNDGTYAEGDRKALAIMLKDAKKYAATGGWGFQAWAGGDANKPIVTDAAKECFACHESRKAHDYVFSTYIP